MTAMDWKLGLSVVVLAWNVALTLWARYVATQSATKDEIQKIKEESNALEARLARAETRPEAVHKIEVAVSALEGDLKKISATVEPIARSTRRIEDYLLNERRGK